MSPNDGLLVMEDAEIFFRNFSGRETMYNQEGDRNFCVFLDDVTARRMIEDGWNVKYTKVREEGDEPRPYMQVSVSFKNRPPRLFLISTKGRTPIDESLAMAFDWVDIKSVDLTVRPYSWAVGSRTGVKAYLKTMYVVIKEDPLDAKYAHLNEAPMDQKALPAGDEHEVLEGEVLDEWDGRAITSH
jgi:hypothetical protein